MLKVTKKKVFAFQIAGNRGEKRGKAASLHANKTSPVSNEV